VSFSPAFCFTNGLISRGALVLFGVLSRWTAGLSPLTLLIIAIPWGFFTSAVEWLFLVPLVPFWQPIFTLEQAYWLGLLVHLTSASLYPLYPGLRDWISGQTPSAHRRFTMGWSGSPDVVATVAVGLARRPRREAYAGNIGPLVSLPKIIAPGALERLVRLGIDLIQVQQRSAPPTEGNLFTPVHDRWKVSGGWRTRGARSRRGLIGLALVGGAIAVALSSIRARTALSRHSKDMMLSRMRPRLPHSFH